MSKKKKLQKEILNLKNKAQTEKKANKKLLIKLKKMKGASLDQKFHSLHKKTFQDINCIDCANCCKTTSPVFTIKDVNRISKYLKIKSNSFYDKFLKLDNELDTVLQKVPCKFLNTDNTCSIYDVRPKACTEYPHTNRKKIFQILSITMKNIEICPAVSRMIEKMK